MPVKNSEDAEEVLARDLDAATGALSSDLDAATGELSSLIETVERMQAKLAVVRDWHEITASELFRASPAISQQAILVFVQTVRELLGDRELGVDAARRAALIAVSEQAWENELGPLLTSGQVRQLLGGISRQRVNELLRGQRLIGLRDSDGRRRFPAFQFGDGQPVDSVIAAFWVMAADDVVNEWTAAGWCVAPDQALGGQSPTSWARDREDPERLLRVARQQHARLAR